MMASGGSGTLASPDLRPWQGKWERCCAGKSVGTQGESRLPDENTVVVVDGEGGSSGGALSALRWSFGQSVESARHGFTTTAAAASAAASPAPVSAVSQPSSGGWVALHVTGPGVGSLSSGLVSEDGQAIALRLVSKASLTSVVYRIVDVGSVLVTVTEVPCGDAALPVTVQEGFMFKVEA